jgi:hypothetical protein
LSSRYETGRLNGAPYSFVNLREDQLS